MMSETRTTLALAAGLGAVAGMRSMTAPALLSHRLSRRPDRARGVARRLSPAPVAGLLALAAAGEMAADKTPFISDRTDPLPLAGRALMGALSGAAVADQRGDSAPGAAFVAALAAVGTTFLAYHLRRTAGARTGLPDLVFALVEDGLAVALGARLAGEVA